MSASYQKRTPRCLGHSHGYAPEFWQRPRAASPRFRCKEEFLDNKQWQDARLGSGLVSITTREKPAPANSVAKAQ
jgi:hypothetical protein